VILEFKSQYAYESCVFPLVSDAVEGIHATIDTREYHAPYQGQMARPGEREIADIDPPLLNRVLNTLIHAFEAVKTLGSSSHPQVIKVNQSQEDYLFGPSPIRKNKIPLSRILGPEGNESSCLLLPLSQIQHIFNPRKKDSDHCQQCTLFNLRFLTTVD
jgi:hypothetical protein